MAVDGIHPQVVVASTKITSLGLWWSGSNHRGGMLFFMMNFWRELRFCICVIIVWVCISLPRWCRDRKSVELIPRMGWRRSIARTVVMNLWWHGIGVARSWHVGSYLPYLTHVKGTILDCCIFMSWHLGDKKVALVIVRWSSQRFGTVCTRLTTRFHMCVMRAVEVGQTEKMKMASPIKIKL